MNFKFNYFFPNNIIIDSYKETTRDTYKKLILIKVLLYLYFNAELKLTIQKICHIKKNLFEFQIVALYAIITMDIYQNSQILIFALTFLKECFNRQCLDDKSLKQK